MSEPKQSMWGIEAVGDFEPEKYNRPINRYFNVVAFELMGAVKVIKDEFPGAKIVSINHKGVIDYG